MQKINPVGNITLITLTFLFIGLLTSCMENPVTGESELSFVSPASEVSIGEKNYLPSQQSQGGRYTVDPDLTLYVNRVGQKLAKVSDRPGLPYEFVVLNNDVPNAWALPGGKIAINRGLLVELKDEAQLAAVLGHEIVHAAARHGATQMTRGMLLKIGVMATDVATQNTEYRGLATTGANLGAAAWQARYGRQDELDSDAYGMEYMAKAGYDPQGAVELQETFLRLSKGRNTNWLEGLFASHPPSQERVQANRKKAESLGGGVRNKAAFDRAMKQVHKDQAAYETHQRAIKAAKKKDYTEALTLTEQAIQKQPREGMFWETKGHLLSKKDQNTAALKAFDRAISNNPDYFGHHLAKGMLAKKMGKSQDAQSALQASQKRLPTQLASFHLGELAMKDNDRDSAVIFYRQAAKGGGELGKVAQQRLGQLAPPSQPYP